MRINLTIKARPSIEGLQLGPYPADGALALISWDAEPPQVDAGIPEPVASVLSRAICSISRVVFLATFEDAKIFDAWIEVAPSESVLIPAPSFSEKIRAKMLDKPLSAWLATTSPERVKALFDDHHFPWWMQSQIAMLFESQSSLPPLGRFDDPQAHFLSDDWINLALRAGAFAALRPAVDGVAAALWAKNQNAMDEICQAIERSAAEMSLELQFSRSA